MTKTVLLGTTNPAKIKRFEELLRGYAVQFYTLRDLHIEQEPRETGATPRENAELKAKFYGQYFDLVICNDSGLYFDGLPMEDPRQPGLHIRTPQGERLDDEQMISYYTTLVHSLGGRVLAYYLDGVAVYRQGKIFSLMETREVAKQHAFYMVDSPAREPAGVFSGDFGTRAGIKDGGRLVEKRRRTDLRRRLTVFPRIHCGK